MPLGKPIAKQLPPKPGAKVPIVRGAIKAVTTVERTGRDRGVVAEKIEDHVTEPVRFDKPHALVSVGHDVSMCVHFQTIKTSVNVTLPSGTSDEEIRAAQRRGFSIVEEIHSERTEWVKEVMSVCVEAKQAMEG